MTMAFFSPCCCCCLFVCLKLLEINRMGKLLISFHTDSPPFELLTLLIRRDWKLGLTKGEAF